MADKQTIDLAEVFGLVGKTDANKDVPDYIGSQLGWDITQFADRFPNYYYTLVNDLGWSNAECLERTYFTAAINEAGLMGYQSGSGFAFNRNKVKIPSGKWWYNSEMRCGRAIYEGAGADNYYGNGATELARTETNWKSLFTSQNDLVRFGLVPWTYAGEAGMIDKTTLTNSFTQPSVGGSVNITIGSTADYIAGQRIEIVGGGKYIINSIGGPTTMNVTNDGTPYFSPVTGRTMVGPGATVTAGAICRIITPSPLQLGGGQEWSHGFIVRDMAFTGTKGDFNNPSYREAGINMHNPGENSGVYNCLFYYHNDFGVLIRGKVAPFRSFGNSFFHNGVAGYGVCGAARASIQLGFSGDFNPYAVYTFRQGEGSGSWNTSPNGVANYWPYVDNDNPGGTITIISPKIESFACSTGYGMSTCPGIGSAYGKGQRLARMTGRFKLNVIGGSMFVHSGKVNSLVVVVDDYYSGNGSIPLANSSVRIEGLSPIRYAYWLHDTWRDKKWVGNAVDDDTQGDSFYWQSLTDSAVNIASGVAYSSISSNCKFNQPFINDSQAFTWNEALTVPNFNYDEVTGTPW